MQIHGIPAIARPFVLDQPMAQYTAADHQTWAKLCARQFSLLKGRMCEPFFDGLAALTIGEGGIPDFSQMSATLQAATGWQVVAVPGLVPDEVFFALLAERLFPAGWWIRSPEQFDYIEEPDVFHDVFGHVPLLMLPEYADFIHAYGMAGLKATDANALKQLARLYWYTVEFGLLSTSDGLRIFGAGIASSPGETIFALESRSPHRVALDAARVMRTDYRIDDFQETYFVLGGFEQLPKLDEVSLAKVRGLTIGQNILQPGDLDASDRVIDKGDGSYHRLKHAAA